MDNEAPIPATFYSNYFAVNHGKFEFNLYFCEARIPPFVDPSKLEKIRAKPVCSVVIPPDLMPAIIEALQVNLNTYQKTYREKTESEDRKDD